MANAASRFGVHNAFQRAGRGTVPITLLFIFIAPLLGAVDWGFKGTSPSKMDSHFRKLQLLSAGLYSFAHGTNNAQNTMGIITSVLVTTEFLKTFQASIWVILSAHVAIALGTLSGGWRIVRTMGSHLTKLKPRGGFCAETSAAISILFATILRQPVSTTHVIAGAVAGVGSIQRIKAVRWGIARDIVWAWVLTIPASAALAILAFSVLRTLALAPLVRFGPSCVREPQ
jgi:PiT family inorganic phosphate transporter